MIYLRYINVCVGIMLGRRLSIRWGRVFWIAITAIIFSSSNLKAETEARRDSPTLRK